MESSHWKMHQLKAWFAHNIGELLAENLFSKGQRKYLVGQPSIESFDLSRQFLVVMLLVPQGTKKVSDRLAVVGSMFAEVFGDLKRKQQL